MRALIEIIQHLPLQMLARRLLDRATLGRDALLVGLALTSRPIINRPRQMRNLWPLGAYLSLLRFRVRIHGKVLFDRMGKIARIN